MKKIRHTGWKVERCRFGLLERIFAEAWRHENVRDRYTAGGILQQLFMRQEEGFVSWFRRPRLVINARDAMVAATVIQWLGTNVGYGFLTKCLERAGLKIVEKREYDKLWNKAHGREDAVAERVDDSYYSVHTQTGYEVVPGAWHNFARQFGYFEKAPEVKMMQRPSWYRLTERWKYRRDKYARELEMRKENERRQAEYAERRRQWEQEQRAYKVGVWC